MFRTLDLFRVLTCIITMSEIVHSDGGWWVIYCLACRSNNFWSCHRCHCRLCRVRTIQWFFV